MIKGLCGENRHILHDIRRYEIGGRFYFTVKELYPTQQ